MYSYLAEGVIMKYGILDYEVIGTGTPVLIIHGWGMGDSEHGDVRNSDDILELLHGFAVDVINEPLIIAGQSYGGLLTH